MRFGVPAIGLGVLALLVLGGVLWAAGAIGDLNPFRTRDFQLVGPTVIHSVRDLSELVTVEVVEYTTIEQGRDAGIFNFARGDRIFLFAVARIGAGIDLSQLRDQDVEVDDEARSVTIRLPEPRIQYVALDNEATQVYDRDTGLFTKGDRDLESEARLAAEGVLREQAVAAGVLDRASENAKETLRVFLRGLGYERIVILGAHEERPAATPTAAGEG